MTEAFLAPKLFLALDYLSQEGRKPLKNLEEPKGLQEAKGLLILTTASVEQASAALARVHCKNWAVFASIETEPKIKKIDGGTRAQ